MSLEQERNERCACGSGKKYKQCCLAALPTVSTSDGKGQRMICAGCLRPTGTLTKTADGYYAHVACLPKYKQMLTSLKIGRYKTAAPIEAVEVAA